MNEENLHYETFYSNSLPYSIVSSSYTILITGVATILILSLIYVIFKNKSINRKIDIKLSILLLFLDLVCSVITLCNGAFSIAHYSDYLNSRSACTLNGIITVMPYILAIDLMGIISLERCLLIVSKREYSDLFYYGIVVIFVILNAVNFIQMGIFGVFDLVPTAVYCFFYPTNLSGIIGCVLSVITLGIPYSLIVFCYIAICINRRNQSQRSQLELGLDPLKVKKEVNKTVLKSLSIITASLLTSGVYVLILVISWFKPSILTPITDMIRTIFVESQMFINTILLLNMQPKLWKELKSLYGFKSE
jgi:hypothetical protein